MNLARFRDLRDSPDARYAAIACDNLVPYAFVELCKKMDLEPSDFPKSLTDSQSEAFDKPKFMHYLKYLIQKDYMNSDNRINDDTANALADNLLQFLDENTSYRVYANFEINEDADFTETARIGLGTDLELGIFIIGQKIYGDTVGFTFAIGFADGAYYD